jgi:signal peptidase I
VGGLPGDRIRMAGDNRDNSRDSRWLTEIGYVPLENFIGRVSVLLFNSGGVQTGNRPR